MVTVGYTHPGKAEEDIEKTQAAPGHRFPEIGKRAGPNQHPDAFGEKQG